MISGARLPGSNSGIEAAMLASTVLALGVDAVLHVRLAPRFAFGYPEGINGGNVFRVTAAAAVVAAVLLLVRTGVATFLLAAAVLGSALVALVLYTYVDVPQLGPIPSIYDPVWYRDKTVTAVAEGLGTLTALIGARLARRRDR